MWVFGYGSLTWKVDFPYEERCVGYVEGFARRFWQGSIDHRGVPGAPGRVVTLIPDQQERIWGIAYKLPEAQLDEVVAHLDNREKCGYATFELLFHPKDTGIEPYQVTVYSASSENPWFLGPAPIEEMAAEIATRSGMSGANSEYLLKLADCMRDIAPDHEDDHLYSLEKKVKEILCVSDKK